MKKILSLFAAFFMVASMWGETYTLVTSASDLEVGATYIFAEVSTATKYVAGTNWSSSKFSAVTTGFSVEDGGNTIEVTSATVLKLELGGEEDAWTFSDGTNFIGKSSSNTNFAKVTGTPVDTKDTWRITFADGACTGVFSNYNVNGTNHTARYWGRNGSTFGPYSGSSYPKAGLYKKVAAPIVRYNINISGSIANGTVEASATQAKEGAVITLTPRANTGYKFSAWNVTNASTSESITVTNNQFTMPAAAVNVSATFIVKPAVVTAQKITFTAFANADKNSHVQWSTSDDFVVTTVGLASGNSNYKADANTAYFGDENSYEQFDVRFALGGKTSSTFYLTVDVPCNGTLKVYARSGSGSASDRTLTISQNTTELFDAVVKDADAITLGDGKKIFPVISVPVVEGQVKIEASVGAMTFYCFKLLPTGVVDEDATEYKQLTISTAQYATYYNADMAYTMPAGLEGITVEGVEGSALTLNKTHYAAGTVVPAGEPLILHATTTLDEATDFVLYAGETAASAVGTNLLKGTSTADEVTTGGDKYYRLSVHEGVVGFYYGAADGAAFQPGANKAYLAVSSSSAPAHFTFTDDATTITAVENVETVETVKFMENGVLYIKKNGVIYNAMGQVVK